METALFTDQLWRVLQFAREEAVLRLGNDHVDGEHLLLGLLREGDGFAITIMKSVGIDLEDLSSRIKDSLVPQCGMITIGQLVPLTPRAKRLLTSAVDEACSLSHTYVCTEHLLLAFLKDADEAKTLAAVGLTYKNVKELVGVSHRSDGN